MHSPSFMLWFWPKEEKGVGSLITFQRNLSGTSLNSKSCENYVPTIDLLFAVALLSTVIKTTLI